MAQTDPFSADDTLPKVHHLHALPPRAWTFDGEDVNDWIKAAWAGIALTGLFVAIPAAIALGAPAYNAVWVYLAVNLACFFAWMLGIDAEMTNLVYGRRTPGGYSIAKGARRAMSVAIQVTMTIAVLESLWLAGVASTAKIQERTQAAAAAPSSQD